MTQGFTLAPSEGFGKPLVPTADAADQTEPAQGQLRIPTAMVCFWWTPSNCNAVFALTSPVQKIRAGSVSLTPG